MECEISARLLEPESDEVENTATGYWTVEPSREQPMGIARENSPSRLREAAIQTVPYMLLALAATAPATAVADDLFSETRRDNTTTAFSRTQTSSAGERVSRRQALVTARRILERAEQERVLLAEREGERGIHWVDDE